MIHGDRRVDHYAWLRKKDDPRVREYLQEENGYAEAYLKATGAFQEELYREMLGRILQTDLSGAVPVARLFLFFTRTDEGKQYVDLLPAAGESDAREEVLLDLNVLAEGHSFLGLGVFEVSDDNRVLAYATDTTGFRQYTLQVKDLRTGEILPLRMERVTSVAWAADNRTLFLRGGR